MIFVWWPKVDHMNVTSYVIQFQSDDPINFTKHVIGTTEEIDEMHTWTDVSGHLTPISAVTNVKPQQEVNESGSKAKSGKPSPKLITELRVDGNVSGVLIPNTVEVVVRVLVSVIDEDGELIQDARFVEWKKVCSMPNSSNFELWFKRYRFFRYVIFRVARQNFNLLTKVRTM